MVAADECPAAGVDIAYADSLWFAWGPGGRHLRCSVGRHSAGLAGQRRKDAIFGPLGLCSAQEVAHSLAALRPLDQAEDDRRQLTAAGDAVQVLAKLHLYHLREFCLIKGGQQRRLQL